MKTKITIFTLCCTLLCSCYNQSAGKKAAKEIVEYIQDGNMEKAQERLQYYGETLHGQDLIDCYDALEKEGVVY